MTRRLLLFVVLGIIPAAAWAETPPLLDAAIGTWTSGKIDWAFTRHTQTINDNGVVKDERVERYDPSLPDLRRWRLTEVNGGPPSAAQIEIEQRKNRKPRKYGSEEPGKLLDLPHATIRKEDSRSVTYEVPVRSVAGGLAQTNKLVVLITVDRKTEAIERFTAQLLGPMRIALGLAKVTDVDLDLSFEPTEPSAKPSSTPAPASGTAHATLSAFGERMEYEWSDFQRVQAYHPGEAAP